MTIDQSISEYKTFFGEKFYNTNPYFISNNIDPDSYMTRLADRVKKPYDVYPAAFTNKRVLDIGASSGDQSFILSTMGNSVTSFDLNEAVIPNLTETVPAGVIVLDNIVGVKENSYDTVFCSAVITQQANPYVWFESLFDIDFKTLVLIYNDGYTTPNHGGAKMYSPDVMGETTFLVEKASLLEVCSSLGLNVIESELNWQENVAIEGIEHIQTALIVEKP